MSKNAATFDVFLSHSHLDNDFSEEVSRVLQSYDLKVFKDSDVAPRGQSVEDMIWEAMAECQAMITVISEATPTSWMILELGAAMAWNKPTYAVATNPSVARLPPGLSHLRIYSPLQIDEIAREIKSRSIPLSDSDQAVLLEEYRRIGMPLDELSVHPVELSRLTKEFIRRTKRKTASEELVRRLHRLRKQGALRTPRAGNRSKVS